MEEYVPLNVIRGNVFQGVEYPLCADFPAPYLERYLPNAGSSTVHTVSNEIQDITSGRIGLKAVNFDFIKNMTISRQNQ